MSRSGSRRCRASWTTGPGGPVVQLDDDERLTLGGAVLTGRHDVRGHPRARRGDGRLRGRRHRDRQARWARHRPSAASRPPVPRRVRRHAHLRAEPALARARDASSQYAAPRPTEVGAAVDGLHARLRRSRLPGVQPCTARPSGSSRSRATRRATLLVLFTDATSGLTTYAANRSVSVASARRGRRRR